MFRGKGNKQTINQMKEDEKVEQNLDNHKNSVKENEQHSMVCNDQLFFQELRIAAEEAERDRIDAEQNKAK